MRPDEADDGVVLNVFSVPVTGAREVVQRYRRSLSDDWRPLGDVARVGPGTYQAEWESSYHHLRVTATGHPAKVAVEYRVKDAAPDALAALTQVVARVPRPPLTRWPSGDV